MGEIESRNEPFGNMPVALPIHSEGWPKGELTDFIRRNVKDITNVYTDSFGKPQSSQDVERML